jgi:carbamoyltransferase
MRNGVILQYLSLERYTRHKYDNRLELFLEELIDTGLLRLPEEFDIVSVNSFVGNAFISANGRIRVESSINKSPSTDLEHAYSNIAEAYNCPHELAHIASCLPFFGEFMDNSLLISFDGGSSLGNFSAFHFINGELKLLECNWEELGYLPKFFNDNALVFEILGARRDEHCSVPGKLMGYACHGSYNEKIELWLKNNGYFKNHWDSSDAILQSIKETFDIHIENYDNKEKFLQNIAATFQYIFERDFIRKIETLQKHTNADYLYYAGGCALNIITNTKIINSKLFKDIFIPPCCNDSGLSIGAAALLERKKGNSMKKHSPYLCNVGTNADDEANITDDLIKQVAESLLLGGIIGICNGNAEVGPRALGNRSLIALANSEDISRKLSMDVKKREWYRPVAPIMLKQIAEKVTAQPVHHLAKFMLLDFFVKEEFEKDLAGVIHANKTARIQTICKENDNPFMFKLLSYLYDNHNILALINTSFNVQGEPIVQTQKNALCSAKKMGLQGVVINNIFHKIGGSL